MSRHLPRVDFRRRFGRLGMLEPIGAVLGSRLGRIGGGREFRFAFLDPHPASAVRTKRPKDHGESGSRMGAPPPPWSSSGSPSELRVLAPSLDELHNGPRAQARSEVSQWLSVAPPLSSPSFSLRSFSVRVSRSRPPPATQALGCRKSSRGVRCALGSRAINRPST